MLLELAILKNFDSDTYKAGVQLAGSLTTYFDDVPVSRDIPTSALVIGNRVILAIPDDNPKDACVIATWPQGTSGGGMQEHGNEYHNPDFAEASHTHSDLSPAHKDVTTGVHGVGSNYLAQAPTASHLVRAFTKGWTSGKLLKGAGVNADPTEEAVGISCRLRRSSNKSIPNATWTTVDWDSEDWDTDNMHDNSSNNSRITIQTAGVYLICCLARFAANGSGTRHVLIKKNGSDSIFSAYEHKDIVNSGWSSRVNCSTIDQASVGDYYEAAVYQNSGGSLNLECSGGIPDKSYFFAIRIL